MQNSEIARRVMLASLKISIWYARRFDAQATSEVERQYKTPGAGRFNKRLLPDNSPEYKVVTSVAAHIRDEYYRYTLEYDPRRVRLMPADVYLEFAASLRKLSAEFDQAKHDFLRAYPDLRERARSELNGLYSEDDYPTVEKLATKFGVHLSVLPFPDASQFGIDFPPDILKGIKDDIDSQVMNAISSATDELMARLFDTVAKLSARLNGSQEVRLDVLNGLRDVVGLLPKLNFAGDSMLDHLLSDAKENLTRYSAAAIKESSVLRSEVAQKAADLQQLMAAYMGSPPVAAPASSDAMFFKLAA